MVEQQHIIRIPSLKENITHLEKTTDPKVIINIYLQIYNLIEPEKLGEKMSQHEQRVWAKKTVKDIVKGTLLLNRFNYKINDLYKDMGSVLNASDKVKSLKDKVTFFNIWDHAKEWCDHEAKSNKERRPRSPIFNPNGGKI